MECKCAGKQIQFIESRSIRLPHLLVIAFPSASRMQNLEIPDIIDLGDGYSYEVVGIALWNTSHYTCNIKIGEDWVFYDDVGRRTMVAEKNYAPEGFV